LRQAHQQGFATDQEWLDALEDERGEQQYERDKERRLSGD
jgi:hypothetical protein